MLTCVDWLSVAPELMVLATTLTVLVVGLLMPTQGHGRWLTALATGGLLAAAVVAARAEVTEATQMTFGGLYAMSTAVMQAKMIIAGLMAVVIQFSQAYIKRHQLKVMEWLLLGLLATVGMMMLAASQHLLTAYLGIELLSLPLYAVVVIQPQWFSSVEAGMKYFIMGAVASAIMLYGMSFLYGACGHLGFAELTQTASLLTSGALPLYATGWILVLVGVLFKLGVAPFHMWVPDTYEGAPQVATLLIASVPKWAMFALMVRLFAPDAVAVVSTWPLVIAFVGVASMLIGNLVALAQRQLWRLLAYSSVAHMGVFILCWYQWGEASMAAARFYMLTYVLATLAMMGALCQLSKASDGGDVTTIDDLKDLYRQHPGMAVVMTVAIFSMAGIPPLVGFMAKLLVIKELVSAQGLLLAVAVMVAAVIGIFYYIRLVRVMFLGAAQREDEEVAINVQGGVWVTGLLKILAVVVVMVGVYPSFLLL